MPDSNIHRASKESSSPFEKFRDYSPGECRFLSAMIIRLTETNDATAEYILQEIINRLYRSADQRLRDMGIER